MNERIESIANEFFSVMPDATELTQYTEYVVRMCAGICKAVGADQVDNASLDYHLGREMGAEVCHNLIRKHFGVE